ncbi:MAG: hypothetical protein PVF54_06170 [Anaerolineae bacterium]
MDDVEILYLYFPEHGATTGRVLDAAETAVRLYGDRYGPYRHELLTVVDVPNDGQGASGMGYPMLVTAGQVIGLSGLKGFRLLELVAFHEVGHQ